MANSVIPKNGFVGTVNQHDFTASTTMTYTGISVTIPAYCAYGLMVQALYQATAPAGIALSRSQTAISPYLLIQKAEGSASASVSGYTGSDALTIYIWAQYATAGANRIRTNLWYKYV